MKATDLFEKLNNPRFYYFYAFFFFFLCVYISGAHYDNYSFPMSSYSNLGNPENDLFMVFNFGFVISVILLSGYVRYITVNLFENADIYRISYIVPVITAVFIGMFPQQADKNIHAAAVTLNVILLAVLAPVNAVGLWRMNRRLFFVIGCITVAFINLITATLIFIPFDWQQLGVLETLIILFLIIMCVILDWFTHRYRFRLKEFTLCQ